MENYSDVFVKILVKERATNTASKNFLNTECMTRNLVVIPEKKDVNFLSEKDRLIDVTDYAIMNGCEYIRTINNQDKSNYSQIESKGEMMLRSTSFNREDNSFWLDCVNFNGEFDKTKIYNNKLGICPQIKLNAKKVVKYIDEINKKNIVTENFVISKKFDSNGNEYHTITFGEYPQSFVGEHLNDFFEKLYYNQINGATLKQTGKIYAKNDIFGQKEYLYKGAYAKEIKLVRTFLLNESDSVVLSKSTNIRGKKQPVWIRVEPISWRITNWDDLSRLINPNGKGQTLEMNLVSEKAIISGKEFYSSLLTSSDYREFPNGELWQNSCVRTFLNGINLHEDLKTNGNINFKAEIPYNYSERKENFITSAFNISPEEIKNLITGSYDMERNEFNKANTNPYGFEFKKLSNDELLKACVKSNTAVFLHGPSGVGKSQRVQQLDPNATRITLRPQMNPEEIDGTLDRETGKFIPPLWWQQLTEKCKNEPNKKHVLFIDELTNVKPTVQSLVYSIVLDRAGKDGLWPLPDNAVVVAAGNESADNLAAYPLTNALFRRFCHIYYEVNKEDWLVWATGVNNNKQQYVENVETKNQAKIHPAIVAYIMSREEFVLNQNLDEDDPKIVTDPRKWEIASKILYSSKNPYALVPAIGEELTADFVDFVRYIHLTVDDVVHGRFNPREFVEMDISSKLSTSVGLIDAKESELSKIRGFIQKHLGKEVLAAYDTMWVRNDPERAQIIAECGAVEPKNNNFKETPKQNQQQNASNITNQNKNQYLVKIENLFEYEKQKNQKGFVKMGHGYYAIRANSENEILQICSLFDRMGKTLAGGQKYSDCFNKNNISQKIGINGVYFGLNGTYSIASDVYKQFYDLNEVDFSFANTYKATNPTFSNSTTAQTTANSQSAYSNPQTAKTIRDSRYKITIEEFLQNYTKKGLCQAIKIGSYEDCKIVGAAYKEYARINNYQYWENIDRSCELKDFNFKKEYVVFENYNIKYWGSGFIYREPHELIKIEKFKKKDKNVNEVIRRNVNSRCIKVFDFSEIDFSKYVKINQAPAKDTQSTFTKMIKSMNEREKDDGKTY